jgi:hypothetical protein
MQPFNAISLKGFAVGLSSENPVEVEKKVAMARFGIANQGVWGG